jgi:hypothetical protein
VRKVIFRDSDGNEIGFGGAPLHWEARPDCGRCGCFAEPNWIDVRALQLAIHRSKGGRQDAMRGLIMLGGLSCVVGVLEVACGCPQ